MKYLVIGLMLLFSQSAFAENRVTVGGGGYLTSNSNYGNGYDLLVRAEKDWGQVGLAIEGAMHGPKGHYDEQGGSYGNMSGISLMPQLFYRPSVNWYLKPYLFGGLGWSWWEFERSEDMERRGIEINLGDVWVHKLGVGLERKHGNWVIGVEASFLHAYPPKESHYESTGEFANVVTDEDHLGEEEKSVMLVISYLF